MLRIDGEMSFDLFYSWFYKNKTPRMRIIKKPRDDLMKFIAGLQFVKEGKFLEQNWIMGFLRKNFIAIKVSSFGAHMKMLWKSKNKKKKI